MDNLENTPAPVAAPSPESDLQTQVDSLQKMVTYILILTTIVSGAFALFIGRQANLIKAELNVIKPQKEQIETQLRLTDPKQLETFGRKLAEYGVTHPDFAPIMAKYGLAKPAGPTGAAPTRVMSPATPPAPAKK